MGQWVSGSNGSTYLDGSHGSWVSIRDHHWPTSESVKYEQPHQRLNYFIWSTVLFFIARQHTDARDIDIANLSVRPSVCLSVRYFPASDKNGLIHRHSIFSPYGSPIILVLPASNNFTKFRRGHPCGGAKYRLGIKISRFSTNKSLYLANDTRYRHSYYGRRIGSHAIYQMVPFPMTLNEP